MGFKSFVSDILKKVLVNVITFILFAVGFYLLVRWIIGPLF